jgi:methanogenic corrinoid protein MtbC1
MAQAPLSEDVFDRSEYERASHQLRLVGRELPPDAVSGLVREVVRRLAFRVPKSSASKRLPSVAQIDLLCHALLSSDSTAGDRVILDAQREGLEDQTIYLGYIAGAARRLGEMWNEDSASFVEVTIACGRLYRIIRGLRHVIASDFTAGREDHPALFALVPGETHTLGIEIATDLFRREGWDVDLAVGMSHDALIDKSENRNYGAIVLVANSDLMLHTLTRLIVALRITQPLAHIVVAGKILNHLPNLAEITGVDGTITSLETAVSTLRGVIGDAAAG